MNKWEKYFFNIAQQTAEMSTCLRRKVGAVIVKDRHIIATGFNGQTAKAPHCKECYRLENNIPSGEQLDRCYAVHAEANSIAQCAKYGISCKGATIFVTHKPCFTCFKLITNAGIKNIKWLNNYPDDLTDELMEKLGSVYAQETYTLFINKRK